MARAPKATTLEYFKLVQRLENERIYTLHDVVEEGLNAGLFSKAKSIDKAKSRAVEALRVRARRNNLKVDKFVNDAKYIHRGYFGWRLKLTYKPAFFPEEEYEALIQHAVHCDGVRPEIHQSIDQHDLTASTRIVEEIKKQAFEETKTKALAAAHAEARKSYRLRMSLALVGIMVTFAIGVATFTRAEKSSTPKNRPITLFTTDLTDCNAVFELEDPLLIVDYRPFGLGDWLTIKDREGYLVQIKRDEVVLETSYGLEAFPLPDLEVLGTIEKDRKNVVIYPVQENKQLLAAVHSFIDKPIDKFFMGSLCGTANFPDYESFLGAATSQDYHIFYSSQVIWTLQLEEMLDRFNKSFGLNLQSSPCPPETRLTFVKPQLHLLTETKENCNE